jgi:hypothetical protein
MSGKDKKPGPEPSEATIEAVRDRAHDGRISCARLRATAEELGVAYREAGSAADREGVRVVSCDLGCF